MRTTERVVLYTAIACLAAATFMRGTERHAVATAAPVASDLGPADAVILTGKDSNVGRGPLYALTVGCNSHRFSCYVVDPDLVHVERLELS